MKLNDRGKKKEERKMKMEIKEMKLEWEKNEDENWKCEVKMRKNWDGYFENE